MKRILEWLIEIEDQVHGSRLWRFFGAKWDSKISIRYRQGSLFKRRWFDYQFYDGFMEIRIKQLSIRYRRHSGRYIRKKIERQKMRGKNTDIVIIDDPLRNKGVE